MSNGIQLVSAIRTTGTFIWLIVRLIGTFAGVVMFGENTIKVMS